MYLSWLKLAITASFLTYAVVSEELTEESSNVEDPRQPNIILFFADDMGYADLSTFGHPLQEYGPIDRMAEEVMKYTQWTTAGLVCSPSRASMLTGRYPVRTGVYGHDGVFRPGSIGGLPRQEVTIAEALGDAGYATGMVGKWHLGINKESSTDGYHLPYNHGFDFVGTIIPFTQHWNCDKTLSIDQQKNTCFLYYNSTIVEQPINLQNLTQKLVGDAKKFIKDNKKEPFFFYFAFPQPHAALFCNPQFCGKSKRGAYGDSINEMAWAVGEILDFVKELEIETDTLALFLSDQGPQDRKCVDEGSSGIFRGGKGSTWEGGFRVPAVAWWPGKIPQGSNSSTFVNSMDIMPTALYLAGSPADYLSSKNVTIDGQLIGDIVKYVESSDVTPREVLYYYCSDRLMGVRYKNYKIHYLTVGDGNTDIVDRSNPVCKVPPDLDCYDQKKVTAHDSPLVFDIMTDLEEELMLDNNSPAVKALLAEVEEQILQHNSTIVTVTSEYDRGTDDLLQPCCNPPHCTCNYIQEE